VIILERYDDLDYRRDKTKTLAVQYDVPVSWKGKSVTLDLSQQNYERLDALLTEMIQAGSPVRDGGQRTPEGTRSRAHGRRENSYYDGLRAFTDERKITKRDGTGRPAYASAVNGKKFDYPDWLIRMYDEHLARADAA
jgi:hypothetical protein